jgi:hypothetical protein
LSSRPHRRTIDAIAVNEIKNKLSINTDRGAVSAIHLRPRRSAALFVCAHGAGAGMRHRFLEDVANALAARDIATLRYQFPFTEAGRAFPDRAPVCEDVVRAAVAVGVELAGDAPLFAGGKSMGGRMTSRADAAAPLPGVRGLVFLGFPLHRPHTPDDLSRGDHLAAVDRPMLFVQGDRDELAGLDAVVDLVASLPAATLHVVDDADHGFDVLRRSGRDPTEVIGEIAVAVAGWIAAALD